ncbi:hypothetical protein AB0J90_26200 [Micromonospora sp. NPDC049523]|uniref:hypothetical protein n=1 Tax=Micromonospora sp. NPDC049523 TaxID=3155921 RepID=UPI00341B7C67
MVAEWILSAVTAGGYALVGAVATDAWETARSGVTHLFSRTNQRRADLATEWADDTSAEITAAPAGQQTQVRRRWEQTWQQRLADLVEEHPDLGEELRTWVDDLRRRLPAAEQARVNTFIARDHATQYNAPDGTITVNVGPDRSSTS